MWDVLRHHKCNWEPIRALSDHFSIDYVNICPLAIFNYHIIVKLSSIRDSTKYNDNKNRYTYIL